MFTVQTSLGAERLNWLKNDILPKEDTTSSFLLLLSSVGSGLQSRQSQVKTDHR